MSILEYAINPRITPVLLKVVMSFTNASEGVTPSSKNFGMIIKNGCNNTIEMKKYPINLWIANTLTIRICFINFLFNRDVKNWDSNKENAKIFTIEMVSINAVLLGKFPKKYNIKGTPINVIKSADNLNM